MDLTRNKYSLRYRSRIDDVAESFFIPALSESTSYDRSVGYFSSSSFLKISRGISALIKNGGTMRLLVSPQLTMDDVDAIENGYIARDRLISDKVNDVINELEDYKDYNELNYLSILIALGKLDIRIAVAKDYGIYHEKIGIMKDDTGNKIAFTGSSNETFGGIESNYESIDIYRSWVESDQERVELKVEDFEALWMNRIESVQIYPFPEAARRKLISFANETYTLENTHEEMQVVIRKEKNIPTMPTKYGTRTFEIRDYQKEAIDSWEENSFSGLYSMATGTGKTVTALSSLVHLWNTKNEPLFVVILCPYKHLAEQWVEDTNLFNLYPIVSHSESKKWDDALRKQVRYFNSGLQPCATVLTTFATFSTDRFTDLISRVKGNMLLIIDEAHGFGTSNYLGRLDDRFNYRLALSATPNRHFDDDGTRKLLEYFGGVVFEFGLDQAIEHGFLCKYKYFPVITYLTDDEYEEYKEITKELTKHINENDGKITVSDSGKFLLIKRARLINSASNKLLALRSEIRKMKDDYYSLVYCGDGSDEEGVKQIDAVTQILGNELDMKVHTFTSRENSSIRKSLIERFSSGEDLQALVAIKCLDEGVNIPSIRNAYILASSTNPKEFIQRRGRVLRNSEGKEYANLFDFIVLPRSLGEENSLSPKEMSTDRALVKREIRRIEEYSNLALNKSVAMEILTKLDKLYSIKE